jgi:predicted aspartyl protease
MGTPTKVLIARTMKRHVKIGALLLMLVQPLTLASSGITGGTRVRITLENDIVFVPVKLSEKGPEYRFVLDTGAELTVVDAKIAAEARLPLGEKIDVLTVGEERTVPTVRLEQMRIGSLRIPPLRAASYDLTALEEGLDSPVHGVLGVDVLGRFPFTIDFGRKEVVIWKPGEVPQVYKQFRSPLRQDNGSYLMPALINGVFHCELLLDTGTNMIQLPRSVWQKLLQVWRPHKMLAGVSSSGQKQPTSYLVRLESLAIGDSKLEQPVVRFVQDVSRGTFAEPGAPGLLGTDILRRFVVTLDLTRQQVFLLQDKRYEADSLEYTTIGVQFLRKNRRFFVTSFFEGSPAQSADIRRGDEILEVQGIPASRLTSELLLRELRGPEGSVVKLKLRRGNQVLAISMERRNLLC